MIGARVRNFWFAPSYAFALAGCRIAVALAMLLNLQRNAGGFSLDTDRYLIYILRGAESWQPISIFDTFSVPAPSADVVVALFWVTLVAGLMLLVGAFSRIAAGTAFASFYVLMMTTNSWGKLTHSYEVVTLGLLILACSRCSDVWSVDALVKRKRWVIKPSGPVTTWHYRWPVKLIQLQFALMFFFAAYNKLARSGLRWAFSENLRNTMVYQNDVAHKWSDASFVVTHAVYHRYMYEGLAAGALFSELTFVLIVFWSNSWLRRMWLCMGIGLVMGLDLIMQLPNWSLMLMMLVFVDWNGIVERWTELVARRQLRREAPTSPGVVAEPVLDPVV